MNSIKKTIELMRRNGLRTWLFGGILLFVLGFWLERAAKYPTDIKYYKETLQNEVSRYEREILDLFGNGTFILNAVQNSPNIDTLKAYEARPYTFLIFDDRDSLLYWNNNRAYPYKTDIAQEDSLVNVSYRIQNADYLFLKESYNPLINGQIYYYTLVVLLPLHEKYSIKNDYLQDHFTLLSPEISKYITVSETPTAHFISNTKGKPLIYLQAREGVVNIYIAWWAVFCYLLGSAGLLVALYMSARKWTLQTTNFHYGFGLLVGGSLLARGLVYYFHFPNVAQTFGLFQSGFTSLPHWWSGSLGEFVLDVGLLLSWALFVHWELRLIHFRHWSRLQRIVGGVVLYGFIFQVFFLLQNLLENIIRDSQISFQFDNLSRIEWSSFLALSGILGIGMSILLVSYKLLLILKQLGFTFRRRLVLFLVSAAIQAVLWLLGGADLDMALKGLLFGSVFSAILSVFVNQKMLNLAWTSLWLIFFSVFGMFVFTWGGEAKQFVEDRMFVSTLANERDLPMEEHFLEVQDSVLKDDFFVSFFTTATFISRRQAVERLLYRYLDPYYFGRYEYNIALYDGNGGLHRGERRPFEEFMNVLNKSETINNNLYFYSDWEGRYNYIARIPIYSGEQLQGLILIEFIPKTLINKGNVFVELLRMSKNKQEQLAGEYKFALYKKDRRVWHSNSSLPLSLPYDFKAPKQREYLETEIKDERYLLYRSSNNNLAIIQLRPTTWQQMLTIFAYIFCIGVLFLGLMAVLLGIVWRLFAVRFFSWQFDQSLRERIQLGIVLVSIISFVAIAIITIFYFNNEYADYHDAALTNRVKTTAQLASLQVQSNFDTFYVLPDINKLSEISRLDVNMYDLSGNLLKSSSENVFERRLLSRQMNPLALYELRNQQSTQFIQDEQIATFKYLSAYVMLRDNCDNPIAYLNLPYDTDFGNTARAQEVAQFLGTLLNVYVFFLILASGAALFIARSITRPLVIIAEKLRQVKLDKKNEQLEWHIRDEIGGIVSRYNQMIIDLETNRKALERTQRESAWRDMAKQVAHEIKNPLTPMKLNIQLLRKLFDTDPEKAKAKIERISNAIVEQIDNLAAIASEFSTFAQMPAPNNETIELSQLLESVLLLFNKEENIQISQDLPAAPCFVFADKNQLLRVFNNLIKNAIQAIPDDREGRINIILTCDAQRAFVAVADNGCGIPTDRQSQIFTPYFTSKSSGTGIGLSMCKTIITMANGKIYFDTTPDVGTTFTVEIPLATPSA
jgi:two-component system, NtrC family, nitrogen regulation sensor histidine kinase NtrY